MIFRIQRTLRKDRSVAADQGASLLTRICTIVLIMHGTFAVYAQEADDLQLFGSLQTIFFHQDSKVTIDSPTEGLFYEGRESRNTFALQQMDLFFRKEISQDFTAFVDLEFQLNYSSENQWGSLSLQEAWLNYEVSEALNIKTGLLFPAFNQLNEIKNRLALHPYLFRPLVYERLLSSKFLAEDFIPEHAFIQVSGFFPFGGFFGDYAVYTGNAESSYITRSTPSGGIDTEVNKNFEFLSGVDPTAIKFKLFGGRIGLRSRNEQMKCGISLTHDYNNLRDSATTQLHLITAEARSLFGHDVPRWRFGADLSWRFGPLYIDAEIIQVLYDSKRADEQRFELEQSFLHAMVGYDVSTPLTVYGSMQWGDYTFGLDAEHFVYSVGAAYHLNSNIAAKGQLIVYNELYRNNPEALTIPYEHNLTITFFFLGFSVLL